MNKIIFFFKHQILEVKIEGFFYNLTDFFMNRIFLYQKTLSREAFSCKAYKNMKIAKK